MEKKFNIRVYGILVNENNEVLLTDEIRGGIQMTKFPGGGLVHGEGTIDCIKREFLEELNTEIEVVKHFYTTDYYQESAFSPNHQLISIYYLVKNIEPLRVNTSANKFDFISHAENEQIFRFVELEKINENDFTFPIDKIVAKMLTRKSSSH